MLNKTNISGQNNITSREQLDNQHNAEAQRERYYATIHKAALQAGEKVPGMLAYRFSYAHVRLTTSYGILANPHSI